MTALCCSLFHAKTSLVQSQAAHRASVWQALLAAIAHTLTLTRAGIYRVHDIEDVRNFLDVWDVLQGHQDLGADVLLDRDLWRAPKA
jgi:hypothetical protein